MFKKEFELELLDIKLRLLKLEKNAHPVRNFVTCDCCKKKLKEKQGIVHLFECIQYDIKLGSANLSEHIGALGVGKN